MSRLTLDEEGLKHLKDTLEPSLTLKEFTEQYFLSPHSVAKFKVADLKTIIRELRKMMPAKKLSLAGNKPQLIVTVQEACFEGVGSGAPPPSAMSSQANAPRAASGSPNGGSRIPLPYMAASFPSSLSSPQPPLNSSSVQPPPVTAPGINTTSLASHPPISQSGVNSAAIASNSHNTARSSNHHPNPALEFRQCLFEMPSLQRQQQSQALHNLSQSAPRSLAQRQQPQQQQPQQQHLSPSLTHQQRQSQSGSFARNASSSLSTSSTYLKPPSFNPIIDMNVLMEEIRPGGRLAGSLQPRNRVELGEERSFREEIRSDNTIRGYQNPYYEIASVVDVRKPSSHPGQQKWNADISSVDYQRVKKPQPQQEAQIPNHANYAMHVEIFSLEKTPMNLPLDCGLDFNGQPLSWKPNRKISLVKEDKIVSSTPIVVPSEIVKESNTLHFIDSIYSSTACYIVTTFIRHVTTEELIKRVRQQTDVYNEKESRKSSELRPVMAANASSKLKPILQFQKLQDEKNHTKSLAVNLPRKSVEDGGSNDPVDDDAVTLLGETISLLDPITQMRIKIAARGRNCFHKDRFDLETYLEFTKVYTVWHCPICDAKLPVVDLLIDDKFNKSLETTAKHITQVRISNDGKFETIDEPPPTKRRKLSHIPNTESTPNGTNAKTSAIIYLDDDSETDDEDNGNNTSLIAIG